MGTSHWCCAQCCPEAVLHGAEHSATLQWTLTQRLLCNQHSSRHLLPSVSLSQTQEQLHFTD